MAPHPHQLEGLLPRYRDFRPTSFDPSGLGCPDQQEWYVAPVSITRDTPEHSYSASNYAVLSAELDKIDPDYRDHEEHTFGHWGPGWFSIILVRPESACFDAASEAANALSEYPILDDSDLSEREYNAACEQWETMDLEERIDVCKKCNVSIFAARRDTIPERISWECTEEGVYFVEA